MKAFEDNLIAYIEKAVAWLKRVATVRRVFSFGAGTFLAIYVMSLIRTQLLPLAAMIQDVISGEIYLPEVDILSVEIVFLPLAVITVMVAPLMLWGKKGLAFQIFGITASVFLAIVIFFFVLATGRLNSVVFFIVLSIAIFFVQLLLRVLDGLYRWLTLSSKVDKQVDPAKLTIIWIVLAFFLGLFIR